MKNLNRNYLRILALGVVLSCSAGLFAQKSFADGKVPEDNLKEIGVTPWTKQEKIYALSKFWMEAKRNFVYMDRVGHERWDSLYRSLIVPAIETSTDDEFSHLMLRFCGFLKDEHTSLSINPDRMDYFFTTTWFSDDWGLNLEYVDGRIIVSEITKVKSGEVPLGSEIVAVNGIPIKDYYPLVMAEIPASTDRVRAKNAVYKLLRGTRYKCRDFTFRRPDGREVTATLRNEYLDYYRSTLKILKYDGFLGSWTNEDFALKWYPGDIAYLKIGTFMPGNMEKKFEEAFPEIRKRAKKLIIDLRYNGGGSSIVAAHFMAHFLEGTSFSDGCWYTRSYNAAYASWGARISPSDTIGNSENKEYYQNYHNQAMSEGGMNRFVFSSDYPRLIVPTAILINYATCSSSENALVMTDGHTHITLIGEPTSGSTGNPVEYPIIPGITCHICTKKDVYPDGREFVGKGIPPHIFVPETLRDLTEKTDRVLERALKYLKK